jgi:hypothetical protein
MSTLSSVYAMYRSKNYSNKVDRHQKGTNFNALACHLDHDTALTKLDLVLRLAA